jgi:hypothetical protein
MCPSKAPNLRKPRILCGRDQCNVVSQLLAARGKAAAFGATLALLEDDATQCGALL